MLIITDLRENTSHSQNKFAELTLLSWINLASQTLPQFKYSPAQIQIISRLIMATQLPQRPQNLMEAILCDADLDSLGRSDFFVISHRLRLEFAVYRQSLSVRDWYVGQLAFLENHRYFTSAAQALREPGKQQILHEIRQLLGIAGV